MTADEVRAALKRNRRRRQRVAKSADAAYTEFRQLVREGKQRRLTPTEMAGLAGVPRPRIYDALQRERGPRLAESSSYDSIRRLQR